MPKNSSLTKLQKYFVSSQPLVHQEALDVLNVVRHLDDHLIGNRAHHLTRGRAAHGDDGSVESVIDREVKPTAIALYLVVELLNRLLQVFTHLLGVNQWLNLDGRRFGYSRYEQTPQVQQVQQSFGTGLACGTAAATPGFDVTDIVTPCCNLLYRGIATHSKTQKVLEVGAQQENRPQFE